MREDVSVCVCERERARPCLHRYTCLSAPRVANCCIMCCSATEAWVEKPSYGKALEEHLTISSREIAFPIEACVTMLLECGMQEEV